MITTHLLEEVKVMGLHLQVLEVTGEVPVVEGAEGVTEILTVKIATAAAVTGEEAMVGVASLEEVAMEAEEETAQRLEAKEACTQEDILHRHACIELVNSQVLLKGIETSGYVIISAARAVVRQNIHRPVWK